MPLFICEKCDGIDNTACGGTYWMSHRENTPALCCECSPVEYPDGSKNNRAGKWHNRFPKEIATQESVDAMTDEKKQHFVGFGRFTV